MKKHKNIEPSFTPVPTSHHYTCNECGEVVDRETVLEQGVIRDSYIFSQILGVSNDQI